MTRGTLVSCCKCSSVAIRSRLSIKLAAPHQPVVEPFSHRVDPVPTDTPNRMQRTTQFASNCCRVPARQRGAVAAPSHDAGNQDLRDNEYSWCRWLTRPCHFAVLTFFTLLRTAVSPFQNLADRQCDVTDCSFVNRSIVASKRQADALAFFGASCETIFSLERMIYLHYILVPNDVPSDGPIHCLRSIVRLGLAESPVAVDWLKFASTTQSDISTLAKTVGFFLASGFIFASPLDPLVLASAFESSQLFLFYITAFFSCCVRPCAVCVS